MGDVAPYALRGFHCLCFDVLGDLRDGVAFGGEHLILGFDDGDGVGEGHAGTGLSGGVMLEHNLNLDTKHTLVQHNVADGAVNVLL